MRYLVILLATLAACFALQAVALRAVGGRTTKGESNFFSSLGRIQAGASIEPEIMVLGSSITGRLPDQAQGYPGVANMGCDGGSAVDALRAMDQGILPTAPWLIIEADTLYLAMEDKPSEIGRALRRPWFQAGLRIPAVAAYARPASFLYSQLLEKRMGAFAAISPDETLDAESLPKPVENVDPGELTPEQEHLVAELAGILRRLHDRGSRSLIVWLPPARVEAEPPGWILELARRSGSLWWDLGQDAAPGTVTLTDGTHMAAPSAARTMHSLLAGLCNLNPSR